MTHYLEETFNAFRIKSTDGIESIAYKLTWILFKALPALGKNKLPLKKMTCFWIIKR